MFLLIFQVKRLTISADSIPGKTSDEEKHTTEEDDNSVEFHSEQETVLVVESPTKNVQDIKIDSEKQPVLGSEVEDDGWQSVQKPRPAVELSLRQRRTNIRKFYAYHKKEIKGEAPPPDHNSGIPYSNSQLYLVKKKSVASGTGNYDHHYGKAQTSGKKYTNRKTIKSVTYRVKSSPPENIEMDSRSKDDGDRKSESVDDRQTTEVLDSEKGDSIPTVGRFPSYKDAALAPPGTISKAQTIKPKEVVEKTKENDDLITESTTTGEESESFVNSAKSDAGGGGGSSVAAENQEKEERKEVESGQFLLELISHGGNKTNSDSNPTTGGDGGGSESDIQSLQIQTNIGNHSFKKLSASAVPFNPSPTMTRAPIIPGVSGVPMTGIRPGVAPWHTVSLHPGVSTAMMVSTSPRTPGIVQHPIPFVYPPPYSQPQATNMFRPNQVAWQCNMASTMWPACQPVEFSVISTDIVNPTSEKANDLTAKSGNGNIAEKNLADSVENSSSIQQVASHRRNNRMTSGGRHVFRKLGKIEGGEDAGGSFGISLRSKSRRKNTLRIPMNVLNRTYGSQSFKLIYNKVVAKGEEETHPHPIDASDESPLID